MTILASSRTRQSLRRGRKAWCGDPFCYLYSILPYTELRLTNMRWTDVEDIAIALEEMYPETDILSLRFTDLWQRIQKLPGFHDDPQRSNEKILEAIQMAWLEEREN